MYQDHPTFKIEKTRGMPLWRYMDFWKFLDLINNKSLFFPNITMLGDQHEGKIPEQVFIAMQKHYEINPNQTAEAHRDFIEKRLRRETLVSSWSANPSESFAMWKMYAKEKLGIGIKTDLTGLQEAFKPATETIYIGEVFYFDKMSPQYDLGNTFYTFLNKHKYYEFEKEVRCITTLPHKSEEKFKNINVDLNALIKEVYISPFAHETGLGEIIEFLKVKHNLNFKIEVSGVNDKWI